MVRSFVCCFRHMNVAELAWPAHVQLWPPSAALTVLQAAPSRAQGQGWALTPDSSARGAVLRRYDGQTFVKPQEVLVRDRLLGTYEVRPALERLRNTLLGSALGLAVGVVAFWGSFAADADASAPVWPGPALRLRGAPTQDLHQVKRLRCAMNRSATPCAGPCLQRRCLPGAGCTRQLPPCMHPVHRQATAAQHAMAGASVAHCSRLSRPGCPAAGRQLPIPRLSGQDGVIYSTAVRSLQDLRDDDDAAAAEQAAQGDRPGYCGDRFFKAFAGGDKCSKFERRRRSSARLALPPCTSGLPAAQAWHIPVLSQAVPALALLMLARGRLPQAAAWRWALG